MFSGWLTKFIAIGAAALAIGGGAYGIVSATANDTSATATTTASAGFGGRGSNARSGPSAGGTVGTVVNISTSSFTLSTPAGQQVTVDNAPSASAVTKGASVLVLGTVNGSTITASRVIAQATSSSAIKVVPFQRGAPSREAE